jgi:hypothetical protein
MTTQLLTHIMREVATVETTYFDSPPAMSLLNRLGLILLAMARMSLNILNDC